MSRYQKIPMPWTKWHHRLHKKLENKEKLLPKRACLLVSVSGGQDSMAMIKLLLDLQRIYEWNLHVWHGDHGWHKQSESIAKELEQWCEKQNLPFFCDRAKTDASKSESAAREWRYQALVNRALIISKSEADTKCLYVLTAHTGSDRAETLILNLARGSDLLGLTSLKEKRILKEDIYLIRPLLNFSRPETKKICEELDLPIWIDPSNQNLDFSRNKIRHEIFPILEDLYSGCTSRIAALSERLSNYYLIQNSLSLLALESIKHEKGICRKKIMGIPIDARKTLIISWLKENKVPGLGSDILEEISYKISKNKPPGSINLKMGWRIIWNKEFIYLTKND